MLNDLSRQGVELNLLSTAFNQAVIDFSHPFGEGQFGTFIEKVSAVEFTMELVDKIRTCKSELVEQFTETSPCDVKAVVPARHEVLVQGFGRRSGRCLVDEFPTDRGVQCGSNLQRRERFSEVTLRDSCERFDGSVAQVQALQLAHVGDLGRHVGVRQRTETKHGASRLDGFDDFGRVVAGQDETTRFGVLLHDSTQGALSVVGQRIGFVEEDDFERCAAVRLRSRKLLHFGSDALQFPLVGCVHLEEILTKISTENVLG